MSLRDEILEMQKKAIIENIKQHASAGRSQISLHEKIPQALVDYFEKEGMQVRQFEWAKTVRMFGSSNIAGYIRWWS